MLFLYLTALFKKKMIKCMDFLFIHRYFIQNEINFL